MKACSGDYLGVLVGLPGEYRKLVTSMAIWGTRTLMYHWGSPITLLDPKHMHGPCGIQGVLDTVCGGGFGGKLAAGNACLMIPHSSAWV